MPNTVRRISNPTAQHEKTLNAAIDAADSGRTLEAAWLMYRAYSLGSEDAVKIMNGDLILKVDPIAVDEEGLATDELFKLSLCYFIGLGVSKSSVEGERLCAIAVEGGLAEAEVFLADRYVSGLARGATTDQDENDRVAVGLYSSAVAKGSADAKIALGWMLESGRAGQEHDQATRNLKAKELYHSAAKQGLAEAFNKLGQMYRDNRAGHDCPSQKERDTVAVNLFRVAAADGLALAQKNLAFMYHKGRAGHTLPNQIARDAVAERLYRLAAKQGLVDAEVALGLMFHEEREGLNLAEKYARDRKAERYYLLAIKKGSPDAARYLAYLYSEKRPAARNTDGWFYSSRAAHYFTKAAMLYAENNESERVAECLNQLQTNSFTQSQRQYAIHLIESRGMAFTNYPLPESFLDYLAFIDFDLDAHLANEHYLTAVIASLPRWLTQDSTLTPSLLKIAFKLITRLVTHQLHRPDSVGSERRTEQLLAYFASNAFQALPIEELTSRYNEVITALVSVALYQPDKAKLAVVLKWLARLCNKPTFDLSQLDTTVKQNLIRAYIRLFNQDSTYPVLCSMSSENATLLLNTYFGFVENYHPTVKTSQDHITTRVLTTADVACIDAPTDEASRDVARMAMMNAGAFGIQFIDADELRHLAESLLESITESENQPTATNTQMLREQHKASKSGVEILIRGLTQIIEAEDAAVAVLNFEQLMRQKPDSFDSSEQYAQRTGSAHVWNILTQVQEHGLHKTKTAETGRVLALVC